MNAPLFLVVGIVLTSSVWHNTTTKCIDTIYFEPNFPTDTENQTLFILNFHAFTFPLQLDMILNKNKFLAALLKFTNRYLNYFGSNPVPIVKAKLKNSPPISVVLSNVILTSTILSTQNPFIDSLIPPFSFPSHLILPCRQMLAKSLISYPFGKLKVLN